MNQNNDLIGAIFHSWVVLEELQIEEIGGKNRRIYKCICECGYISKQRRDYLVSGASTRCDRCSRSNQHYDELKLYIRKTYGFRTIIQFAEKDLSSDPTLVEVECICGSIAEVVLKQLKKGLANKCMNCSNLDRKIGLEKSRLLIKNSGRKKKNGNDK